MTMELQEFAVSALAATLMVHLQEKVCFVFLMTSFVALQAILLAPEA